MGHFLIVSKVNGLEEYIKLSKEYQVSFEINDFFSPQLLDDKEELEAVMEQYIICGIPKNSTMHGAFLDLAIFSNDGKIREISEFRMAQSMEIAKKLGLKGVVFHANYNSKMPGESYKKHVIDTTSNYLAKLLKQYSTIEIYIENMFEENPDVLKGISEQLKEYPNYGVCLDWAHVNVYGKLEASEELYIMIGQRGEIYHINKEKFEKTYSPSEEQLDIFEQMLSYLPEVQNCETEEFITLDEMAYLCYPKISGGIYAIPLECRTKVFNPYNNGEYFLGREGDYLAIRYDDFTDIYIIQKDIFQESYEETINEIFSIS